MPSKYNEQYYFVQKVDEEDIPNIPELGDGDANTQNRHYEYEAEDIGSAPLLFRNDNKEDFEDEGYPLLNPLPPVLFNADDLIITTEIRNELLRLEIPHLHMHPAVYIHDDDEWHENYWFCTFTESLDCWDRKTSEYMDEEFSANETPIYSVTSFNLNTELLDKIPLQQRLLFRMGASSPAMITCHESIKHLFESQGSQTIEVADW